MVKFPKKAYDDWCMNRFNITEESVHAHPMYTPERRYTLIKEMAGESFLAENKIFQKFFGDDCIVEKVTDPTLQKRGVDFKVIYDGVTACVDLKSCVGPNYMYKYDSCMDAAAGAKITDMSLPLEVAQYGKFTNKLHDKLTDYFIYVILDDNHECAYLVPFKNVFNITKRHYITPLSALKPKYRIWVSSNGSATYINVPASAVATDRVFIRRPKYEHF